MVARSQSIVGLSGDMARVVAIAVLFTLAACGGGSGGGSAPGGSSGNGTQATYTSLAEQCAAPRPAGTIDPLTGEAYGDVQGSLTIEKEWIRSYVNETYLFYADVPIVNPAPYVIGATVPYVDPTDNSSSTELLTSNYDVVDAYFNSQRSPYFTASGKPKDQFHFTYVTSVWDALETAGNEAGFGFTAAVLAAVPPRNVVVAYTQPNSPATQLAMPLMRGYQFLTANGVDVINDSSSSGVATLNEAFFSPIPGNTYTFTWIDPQTLATGTAVMVAGNITSTPVLVAGTLPAPNASIGYILFNEHVATSESELIDAVTLLETSNGGAGVSDLVLDIRYNGGGLLDIASELAYMIAGPIPTTGAAFETETFNNKNPFGLTVAEATTPFHNVTQGFSTVAGTALPYLSLSRVYVLTGSDTCSASEAIINGLRGVGIEVIQIGDTTCGKPYGFYPQDNCSTTYFTLQFQGVNNVGFGAYADGFIPGGTGGAGNDLPGCVVADDFTEPLGNPAEARLAAALQYRANASCPAVAIGPPGTVKHGTPARHPLLVRGPAHESKILLRK